MTNLLVIQGIGALAYLLIALSYLRKTKKDILFVQMIAYLLFSVHFYLLNGITGSICNIIGFFALISIYLLDKYKLKCKKLVSLLFIIILIIINTITFQNIFSIFPMIALIISIMSFINNNENIIRLVGIISALSWLIYGIAYKSYISIIYQGVTLLIVAISIIKNKKRKRRRQNRK